MHITTKKYSPQLNLIHFPTLIYIKKKMTSFIYYRDKHTKEALIYKTLGIQHLKVGFLYILTYKYCIQKPAAKKILFIVIVVKRCPLNNKTGSWKRTESPLTSKHPISTFTHFFFCSYSSWQGGRIVAFKQLHTSSPQSPDIFLGEALL